MEKAIERLKAFESTLKPQIDKILNHRFLERLKEGNISMDNLKVFALQYGIYCSYFPRFLAAAAANVPDDNTRFSLIENLWEEHGSGDLQKSHRYLYHKFCKGIGLSDADIEQAQPFPATRIYVEYLLNLCQDASFLTSLGALGPGTEFFTSQEYIIIYDSLRKMGFSDETLEFWYVHIDLDDHHYGDMVNSFIHWITDDARFELLKEGAERAIELEFLFWEGLEDHIFGV